LCSETISSSRIRVCWRAYGRAEPSATFGFAAIFSSAARSRRNSATVFFHVASSAWASGLGQ
jgi:hypothetical protein